jgi:hypothetical protein
MRRYARLVEEALSEQNRESKRIEPSSVKLTLPVRFPDWLPDSLRVWVNHLWILVSSRSRIMRCEPDLVHIVDGSYGYVASRVSEVPTISTIHDLIPLLQQQEKFGPDQTSILSRSLVKMTIKGMRDCNAMIADSGNTRHDLIEAAGITEKEIKMRLRKLIGGVTRTRFR